MPKIDPETQPFIKKSLDKMHEMLSPKKKLSFFKEDPEIEIDGQKYYLASFNRRLLATAFDTILTSFFIMPLSQLIASFGLGDEIVKMQLKPEVMMNEINGTTFLKMLYDSGALSHIFFIQFFCLFLLGVYNVWFWKKKGATIGKMLFKCQVLNAHTYKRVSIKQGIIRFISAPLSILSLMIGLFMIEYTEKRQALHDKIADTIVVYRKKRL